MSKKDIEEYYNQVCNDYSEMIDTLKDMEELAAQNIVNPDRIEALKTTIEPLKNNYQTLSWVMYLLNQPVKKSKQARYQKAQIGTVLKVDPKKEHSPESIRKENRKVLDSLNINILNSDEN